MWRAYALSVTCTGDHRLAGSSPHGTNPVAELTCQTGRLAGDRPRRTMDTKITSQGSADFVEAPGKDYVAHTELKPGTVGLTGAIMQNIALIAPAIAAFFFTQTLVG